LDFDNTIMGKRGGILWKRKNVVPEKTEDPERTEERQRLWVAKPLNAGLVGIEDPARTGENPPKFDAASYF
jgi:hypothetical protein